MSVQTFAKMVIGETGVTFSTTEDGPQGTVTSVTATAPITSTAGTTPVISTSMATNKLIGRSTAGTGVMEEISVGTNLALSAGSLSTTADVAVWKQTCRVGATSNTTLSGAAGTVDGVATANGDYILLTGQTAPAENGPWVINTGGAWTRPTWYPAAGTTQAFYGAMFPILAGTTLQGSTYYISTTGAITIDSTSVSFTRYTKGSVGATSLWGNSTGSTSTPTNIALGSGLSFSGNTLNVTGLTVPDGGTGVASLTAYAPVFGGTTSTGAVQSGTVGTSGQVLTSNGAGALPTFQTASTGDTFLKAYKTADQSITSNTTLANDTHLSVTVLAKVYKLEIHYSMSNAAAVGGFKMDLSGGSATITTGFIEAQGLGLNQSSAALTTSQPRWTGTTLTTTWSGSGSVNYDLIIHGTISFDGAGTFIPKVAQSVSDAGASVFRKGSYMVLQQMN